MTDEEKVDLGVLIAELRHAERPLCGMAADEIERLAKRVADLEALPPDNAKWAVHDNHYTFKP